MDFAMSRRGGLYGIGLGAALATLAFAPAALAAPPFSLEASKHNDGPYEQGSPISAKVKPGHTKSFFWRISSNGDSPPNKVTLDDSSTAEQDHPGLHIKWFRKGRNITDEVEGSGFEFPLKFDEPKVFRAQVKATGHGDVCLIAHFEKPQPSPFDDAFAFAVNNEDACI